MAAKKRAVDVFIFLTVLSLLAIGIIMVFSSSAVGAWQRGQDPYAVLRRQLIWAGLGIVAMVVMMNFDYRRLKRLSWILFPVSLGLLIVVLFVARDIKGSMRWIPLGPLTIQPSELAKFSCVLFLSFWLSELKDGVKNFVAGVLIPLVMIGVVCALIMLEPDLGTTIVIFGSTMLILFVAGVRKSHLTFVMLLGAAAGYVLAVSAPYRRQRLISFLDPWADRTGSGWQIIQSLYALGSGGLFGLGLGRGRQKFSYLPEPHTDFIFSSLGEELGFIGTALVLLLFFLLAWRGLRVAMESRDSFGALLAAGITSMIVFQAILNIGVVTSSLPVTGVPLPLISAGGSSLTITLGSIGVLLNISKGASSG